MDDTRRNKLEMIQDNLPKNKRTKKVFLNNSDLVKLKNKESYKGPDFYLLNRVMFIFLIFILLRLCKKNC